MRALITGGSGFVGTHLANMLADEGEEVFVLSERDGPQSDKAFVHHLTTDIRRADLLTNAVRDAAPHCVYHLAAISSVPAAWRDPRRTFEVNVLGTMNVLEACKDLEPKPRILNISSGQVYGDPETPDVAFDESHSIRPANPYATSKAMTELLANQYRAAAGSDIVTARSFNHIGPGQSAEFACSGFARQFARIERGLAPPVIYVGNLSVERDFTDVRDVVRAYRLLQQRGVSGQVYNVCSGAAYSLVYALEFLRSRSNARVEVRVDAERVRLADAPRIRGNPAKIRREMGWTAVVPFEQSLTDILDDWRQRISADAFGCTLAQNF